MLKREIVVGGGAFLLGFAGVLAAFAGGDFTQQSPVEIRVELGSAANEFAFVPNQIELETGKLYKVVLRNLGKEPHYFSSAGLASRVFTRKVVVAGSDAKALGEIKGVIREIEVFPGGVTEWWFIPVQTGSFGDLHCSIKGADGKTHAERGMVGQITIK